MTAQLPLTPSAWAAALAALLVGAVALRWRPAPPRVRALLAPTVAVPAVRFLRRGAGWLGRIVLLIASLVLWPPGVVVVVAWWWASPRLRAWRAARRRAEAVARVLPDVIDLMVLLVGSGSTVPLAVAALGRVAPPPLGPGFADVARRRERGQPLADALATLPQRFGPAVRPLTNALVATERYGVALGPTLEQLAAEARRERRRLADTAARKLPVRLSFPLVCCILPAFGLLTVAPLIAGALGSLHV